MKTSADGRAFIEAFEDLFLHTYDDGTGVLTIGYGHTSAAGPPVVARGQTITAAQAGGTMTVLLGTQLPRMGHRRRGCRFQALRLCAQPSRMLGTGLKIQKRELNRPDEPF
jgi:hypothetical protein